MLLIKKYSIIHLLDFIDRNSKNGGIKINPDKINKLLKPNNTIKSPAIILPPTSPIPINPENSENCVAPTLGLVRSIKRAP